MITSIDLQYRKLLSLDPIELTEQGLKTISTHLTLPADGNPFRVQTDDTQQGFATEAM